MANYKAGEKTREKILTVARELVYRNGSGNTTYAQISQKADVNLGTIIYHFKSLDGLFGCIYDDILNQRSELIMSVLRKKFSECNNATLALAQYRINTQSYIDYPNYAHFIAEQLFKSSVWNTEAMYISLEQIAEDFGLELSENEIYLHKFLFLPFASLAASAINDGYLNSTVKEICEYQSRIRLESLRIPKEIIDETLKKVDEIASQVRISVDELMFAHCD